ncbi:Coiled-coil domain-containing protein 137-like [Homarus americanus]|uniref:Coiled-coil domain-containing protein 137-like n=1 Tax=Homarus americanus TaxID=6706 RepID=A0A8J5JRT8_HOMAM|nr:Coiled-coil domain-containing protein 137-like [Homarus americanus]
MGRKIPGKKHRGVKDPYKQQEQRFNKIKDKVNRKPSSTDVQEIPRKLHKISKFEDNDKSGPLFVKKMKKKKKKDLIDATKFMDREKHQPGMTRPLKMVPMLKQHPHESEKKFVKRVDRATKVILKEAAFEDKFQVDVMRDEQGSVTSVKRRENSDPLLSEKKQLEANERAQRKKQARKERDIRRKHKNKKEEDDDEFSYYQDKVEFGEVVYEPPSLDTEKLTRKVNGGVTKPKTFLFMDKLKRPEDSDTPASSTQVKSQKKGNISAARKRILEEERVRVPLNHIHCSMTSQP